MQKKLNKKRHDKSPDHLKKEDKLPQFKFVFFFPQFKDKLPQFKFVFFFLKLS